MSRKDKSILRVENILLELLIKHSGSIPHFDIYTFRVENTLLELFRLKAIRVEQWLPELYFKSIARLQAVEHTLGGYCHRKR